MRPFTHRPGRAAGGAATVVLLCAALSGCGADEPSSAAANPARTTPVQSAADSGQFFAADSVWNQRGDALPVDPASRTLLTQAAKRVGVVDRAGDDAPILERRTVTTGLTVNTRRWTTPIVTGGVATRVRCRQAGCGEAVTSLRIPTGVDPDPRYDGWFTVIEGRKAYDLWRARRERDDTISYQYLRVWDLDGSGTGKPGEPSARGSGLPLFAGLIRSSELDSGTIRHALAISLPGPAQRRYVRPASTTNGNGAEGAVPEGARIRLKPGVRLSASSVNGRSVTRRQQRARDAIVVALRQYGAIVVDRSVVPTLYAQRGIAPDALVGDELRQLTLDDFEVTRLGPVLLDPPATQEAKP
ncbi:MAG: hypothetical protein JHD16_11835 [Solirubrobacteraceae bacterium]|nr:hypothetical protein [Solirubrobacteraceae bacterium]